MSPLLPRLAALPAALLLAVALAVPALADAKLVEANPDDGAVLATPPTVVTLRFNEGVDAGKSSFRLSGPDGEVGTGRPPRDGGRVMSLGGLALVPGEYTVKWTVGSGDGHLVRGTLTFTILEPTPAPATPAATAAASGAPSATPEPVPSPEPATPTPAPASAAPSLAPVGADAPAAASGDVLLPIVAGLVLVAGIGVLVLRRSRRA